MRPARHHRTRCDLVCALSAMMLAACRNGAAPPATSDTTRELEAGTPPGASANGTNPATAPSAGAPSRPASSRERVTIHTSDGWSIVGDYTPEPGAYAVVLVHQLSSNRSEWEPLVARLHAAPRPITTLAIDLRGHGESIAGPAGPTLWPSFGSETRVWSGIVRDVAAAVTFARNRSGGTAGIVVVGSSIGSSAAMRYADTDPALLGVVLLSPGTSYRGLDTLEPMQHYGAAHRPALLVAADGDRTSAQSVAQLVARAGDDPAIESLIFPGLSAHGVAMAADGAHPDLWDHIDHWIRALVSPPAPAASPSPAAAPASAPTVIPSAAPSPAPPSP